LKDDILRYEFIAELEFIKIGLFINEVSLIHCSNFPPIC